MKLYAGESMVGNTISQNEARIITIEHIFADVIDPLE